LVILSGTWAESARKEQDHAAIIRKLLEERTAAVLARDLSGVERLYANDETLTVFRPDGAFRGWTTYKAFWEEALPGVPDGFRINWHDDLVVYVNGDQIVVGSLTWSTSRGESTPQEGRITIVVEKRGDRYVIVHEHLSTVQR
jgi:ketosteroid isomerase-like protein